MIALMGGLSSVIHEIFKEKADRKGAEFDALDKIYGNSSLLINEVFCVCLDKKQAIS